jgi:tetratricopeptide (TPR) repeat protein
MRRWVAFLAMVAWPAVARAETPPSAWEMAKSPGLRQLYEIHVMVQRAMNPIDPMTFNPREGRRIYLERARSILEEVQAEKSPYPLLRYDLGAVYEELDRHEAAIRVLKGALAMAPGDPSAADAWLTLAYAYAKSNMPVEERDAYLRHLAAGYSASRMTVHLNLAESEMRLGHLEEAIQGYRDTIQMAAKGPPSNIGILAQWGLAVALDRFGDTSGGYAAAKWATESDHERVIDNTETVFFVPDYERNWYHGLRAIVRAEAAGSPQEAALRWKTAEGIWANYVERATKPGIRDAWVARAKAHQESAKQRRIAAEKRLGAKGAAPSRTNPGLLDEP